MTNFLKQVLTKKEYFGIQGSYRCIQCSHACHNKIYDATEMVKEMINKTQDCKIPTELVPVCPICGESMDTNLRKDEFFVQDDNWYKQDAKYGEFLDKAKNKKVVLLEFGVGFNTPTIIRFPFEQMTLQNKNWNLVRINKDNIMPWLDIGNKAILIRDDIDNVIRKLLKY